MLYLLERRYRSINGASKPKSKNVGLLVKRSITCRVFKSVVTKCDLQLRVMYSRISGGDVKYIDLLIPSLLSSELLVLVYGEGEDKGVASRVKNDRCLAALLVGGLWSLKVKVSSETYQIVRIYCQTQRRVYLVRIRLTSQSNRRKAFRCYQVILDCCTAGALCSDDGDEHGTNERFDEREQDVLQCYSNTNQRMFFFFSFAAARPAALFSFAAFMSFGAVVRTCLICVGIMCVERLSSTAATSEDSQLADKIGSDVTSERRPDSPGALSYVG